MKRLLSTLLIILGGAWTASAFDPMPGPVMLVAGDGTPGYRDGNFATAKFDGLGGLLLDTAQNILYVADGKNGAIRQVELNTRNAVSTLVGKNGPGNQDGNLASGRLREPAQMIFGENQGVIYVSDAGNHQIKRIDRQANKLSTLSGNGKPGFMDGEGKAAQFSDPQGLLFFPQHRKLLVADAGNSALRLVDILTGQTRTIFKSAQGKLEFNALFFNSRGQLFATCRNQPGIWAFRLDADALLSLTDVIIFSMQPKKIKIKAEQTLLPESDITALTAHGPHLFYSLKKPAFGRKESPLHLYNLHAMEPVQPLDYHLWLPERKVEGNTRPAEAVPPPPQQYRLYDTAQGLAYHPIQEQLFISDETNHRIIAIRLHRHGDFPKGTHYPKQKPPNVKRIMLFGNSMNYSIADRRQDKHRDDELADSLSKRLEYWLNLLSLAQGRSARYEVIYSGGAMFYSIPSVAYAFNYLQRVKELDVDLVLYNYTYFDLVYDAVRYIKNPCVNDELQFHGYDPEFLLTPVKERELHPLGRELRDYIINNPKRIGKFAKLAGTHIHIADRYAVEMLENQDNLNIFFKLATNELNRYYQFIQKHNTEAQDNVGFVINLIPVQANINNSEILTPYRQGKQTQPNYLNTRLKAWCQGKKIGFQDTIEMAKIVEPQVFPFFSVEENIHYSTRGADLIAFFTASQLLERMDSAPVSREGQQP